MQLTLFTAGQVYAHFDGICSSSHRATFEQSIDWLALTGITHGCNPPDKDRFCQEAGVTRADGQPS